MTLSLREQFSHALHGRAMPGDALVVLCGEDARARVEFAASAFKAGWAPRIVLSGGRHEPPRILDAEHCKGLLMGHGVAPDRIILDVASQHTREQAVEVVAMAEKEQWGRLLIVASAYHQPRAYLTFLKELQNKELTERIRLVPAFVSSAWFEPPDGGAMPRLDIAHFEAAKCEEYAAKGHVADYASALSYLEFWEAKP